jgi:uncharacterized membrane protein (UPF0127 family)
MLFQARHVALSGLVGSTKIPVLLADTPARRELGLQGEPLRRAMGMLFTWRRPARRSLHMRRVPEPLDVFFFNADGVLTAASYMPPGGSCSERARYVLEVPHRIQLGPRMGLRIGASRLALLAPTSDVYVQRDSV